AMREVSDDGVLFVSPVDGARHFLTPERSMEAQHRLGADVIMMFDECARHPCPEPAAREAMRRTHAWAARCQARHRALCAAPPRPGAPQPLLFGLEQGATFLHLRRESAEAIVALDLPGHAIGGLSVGESWSQTAEVIEATAALLPADRPRYLMGVGRPEDVLRAVALGIDMFDCVLPTRGGRHGVAYTRRGLVRIRNREHAAADRPLDETCACPTCARHSRAYLRHLFHEGEGLAATLLTLHNVHFFLHMMRQAREAILADRFAAFAGDLLREIAAGDHA
ncbi:MAG: tRNA-guanine transglycosylase, partial [Planctomycetes bacterium]|nr:tRNA-guanine transglycosylase [Planctomycetota bacterium]